MKRYYMKIEGVVMDSFSVSDEIDEIDASTGRIIVNEEQCGIIEYLADTLRLFDIKEEYEIMDPKCDKDFSKK